jgi:competence protein ComGC
MIRAVLHQSLHLTFISLFVIAIFAVVLLLFVPSISIGAEKTIPLEALSPLED